jgi:hypothetical protein
VEEWAALKSGDQNDNSFERSVGAFDLFILEDAPEGDINDVSAAESFRLMPIIGHSTVSVFTTEAADRDSRSSRGSMNTSTDFVMPTQPSTTSLHGRKQAQWLGF